MVQELVLPLRSHYRNYREVNNCIHNYKILKRILKNETKILKINDLIESTKYEKLKTIFGKKFQQANICIIHKYNSI